MAGAEANSVGSAAGPLEGQVLPLLADLYGLEASELEIDDLFVVKYEAGKQAR